MFLCTFKPPDKALNINRAKIFLHENLSKWCKIQVISSILLSTALFFYPFWFGLAIIPILFLIDNFCNSMIDNEYAGIAAKAALLYILLSVVGLAVGVFLGALGPLIALSVAGIISGLFYAVLYAQFVTLAMLIFYAALDETVPIRWAQVVRHNGRVVRV